MTQEQLTAQQIVDLCKQHTMYEWSAQSSIDPIRRDCQRLLLLHAGGQALPPISTAS